MAYRLRYCTLALIGHGQQVTTVLDSQYTGISLNVRTERLLHLRRVQILVLSKNVVVTCGRALSDTNPPSPGLNLVVRTDRLLCLGRIWIHVLGKSVVIFCN